MSDTRTITLESPIRRGDQTIAQIDLRKPNAGALRGAKLVDLLQMDVAALTTILPRISEPSLTAADVANLDPADLFQCGAVVSGFLLTKAERGEPDPAYPIQ